MSVPIAPLAAKYGNPRETAFDPITGQFRKGGVRATKLDGINQGVRSWSVSVDVTNGLEIRSFFRGLRSGDPFRFDHDGNPQVDKLYICLPNWSLVWKKEGVHTFQGTFEQVYRHGVR